MLSISLLPWCVSFFLTALLIRRYSKLRSIPGPFLASITDLWRTYQIEYGSFNESIGKWHERYGPFLRIGPNTVIIADSAAVSTVYSMHGEFKKADSYQPLRVLSHGKIAGSVIDMQDEAENTALRRAVGNAFAIKNILDYEADVDYTTENLIQTLRKARSPDVFLLMQQFQVDFLMKAAFSRNTDYLTARKSTSELTGHTRLSHWTKWQSMPTLERVFYKSPFCKEWYRRTGKPPLWTAMATEELHTRQKIASNVKTVKEQDLLSKYIEGANRHKDVSMDLLRRMISSTISAGFDTSAFTMTAILYFLLKTPDAMRRVQAELNKALGAGELSNPPRYTETDKMPYLAAVIKEAMRLYHFLAGPLERVVPVGGAEIAGRWLPGGTVVAVPAGVVHRDKTVYGEDACFFWPERWLQADEHQRIVMERTMLSFGAGKRICLGRHIAELEMKKVIPRLLLEFDMGLDDPEYILEPVDKYSRFMKPFSITFRDRI
ncbi:cytochrome P450 [Exophiala viscosa]|uniref:Cytochrome P450 n=1 Tax=Exophiala viscosa TaxID=2486360 RepID=A0AAN6E4V8_9EURO|nr:cytochrome P450 [Exophiala viscosa]